MKQLLRENLLYIVALVAGLLWAPLFWYLNMWDIITAHALQFMFAAGGVAMISMAWLLKTDIPRRSKWAILEVVIIVIMLPLVYGSGTLMYEAHQAWGPDGVHWHADYRVVIDGKSVDLINPQQFCQDYLCRLDNHTGVSYIHSHGDNRIHIEGPVPKKQDATLQAFFTSFGGNLTNHSIRYRSNTGWVNRSNTGNKTLKVFVKNGLSNKNWPHIMTNDIPDRTRFETIMAANRTWHHIQDPANYIISPIQKGPVDKIYFLYDANNVSKALQDLEQHDRYRGVSLPNN